MNALLLSAGPGTRLRPLTLETPKCLLPLFADDEPILRYWIDTLIDIGIENIFINVFHLKEKIKEYENNLPLETRLKIGFFDEGDSQKTIGSVLYNLKSHLGKQFLVINSDTYIELNDIVRFIESAKGDADRPICIGVEKKQSVKRKSDARIKDGEVIKFIEKPNWDGPGYSWAGICLMDKSIFQKYTFEQISKKQLANGIFQDFKMTAVEIGSVIDIGDSLEVYYKTRKKFKEDRIVLESKKS